MVRAGPVRAGADDDEIDGRVAGGADRGVDVGRDLAPPCARRAATDPSRRAPSRSPLPHGCSAVDLGRRTCASAAGPGPRRPGSGRASGSASRRRRTFSAHMWLSTATERACGTRRGDQGVGVLGLAPRSRPATPERARAAGERGRLLERRAPPGRGRRSVRHDQAGQPLQRHRLVPGQVEQIRARRHQQGVDPLLPGQARRGVQPRGNVCQQVISHHGATVARRERTRSVPTAAGPGEEPRAIPWSAAVGMPPTSRPRRPTPPAPHWAHGSTRAASGHRLAVLPRLLRGARHHARAGRGAGQRRARHARLRRAARDGAPSVADGGLLGQRLAAAVPGRADSDLQGAPGGRSRASRSRRSPTCSRHRCRWSAEALEALGVPVIGCDGFEADDVIGTLAGAVPGPVEVVTGDRDLFQLVDDRVRVLYTARGVGRLEEVDDAWLIGQVRHLRSAVRRLRHAARGRQRRPSRREGHRREDRGGALDPAWRPGAAWRLRPPTQASRCGPRSAPRSWTPSRTCGQPDGSWP